MELNSRRSRTGQSDACAATSWLRSCDAADDSAGRSARLRRHGHLASSAEMSACSL